MKLRLITLGVALCTAAAALPMATAAPKVTVTKSVDLPAIWKSVPAGKRLQYVRAAELDATRALAERIMGISVDGETTVKELAAADDSVKGTLAATLKGVKTVGKPTYHEDGRVEVIRSVKTQTLMQTISQKLGSSKQSVCREVVTAEIEALGNAAIPGSDGHARVMAKRAAELDVYRRLAERAAGIQITSTSTMRDFVVQSDELKAAFANVVKGAEITEITYMDDNSAEVSATMKIGPLVRVIVRTVTASGKVTATKETSKQLEITEVGSGAAPGSGGESTNAATTAPTTNEIDILVEQALGVATAL